MTSKDEPIQPWNGKAGESFRAWRNRLRLHCGSKIDKSGSSVTEYLDGNDMGTIAAENLNVDKIDAYKAFTQEFVDAEIYVEMPDGFVVAGHVLRLTKALEGIKQGAYLWFGKNKRVLTSIGFESSPTEPNIYVHRDARIIVGVFADDILVGYHPSCADLYMQVKQA